MRIETAAALGALGGLVPDGLRLLGARHDGLPAYLRTWFFWTSLVVLALLGALVSGLSHPHSPYEALALGYSAPSIVSALGARADAFAREDAAAPHVPRARGMGGPIAQLRAWWAR